METFNDLKLGDFIYVAGKFGKEMRIYERKVQTVKNSAQLKNGLLIKPVNEDNILIPKENCTEQSYSGDNSRLVATSKEALQKIAIEFAQERLRKADERISQLKKDLDDAVKYRNSLSGLIASIVL